MACIFCDKPYVFSRCAKGAFFRCKNTRFSSRFVKAAGPPENKKGSRYAPGASETFYVLCRLFLLPNAGTCALAVNFNKLHFENNRGIFRNRTACRSSVSKV